MPTEIKTYEVRFYGGTKGHLKSRSQITLYGDDEKRLGFIRFQDPEALEDDEQRGELITMHLPTTMLPAVLDLLRHETSLTLHFAAGKGFLTLGQVEVGDEAEEEEEATSSASPKGTSGGQRTRFRTT